MSEIDIELRKSIARITYLVAASDGAVNRAERELFKKTLKVIEGFKFGTIETTEFIEKTLSDAESLVRLRDFYSDEEMIKALMDKVAADIILLKREPLALRMAFAAWISICVADRTFSDYERKIIKGLQIACNDISQMTIDLVASAVAGPIGGLLAHGLSSALGKIATKPKEYGPDARVPDAYLDEIESRCFEIDALTAQYEASTDELERNGLKMSIDSLTESFCRFVNTQPSEKGE